MLTSTRSTCMCVFLLAFLSVCIAGEAKTIYVSLSGDGSDGQSWATAYFGLPEAIVDAEANDRIYISEGTYIVGGPITVPSDIRIEGGFADPGKGAVQQNPVKYPTILDGDGAAGSIFLFSGVDNVLIKGLTLTGCVGSGSGYGEGGAIRCEADAAIDVSQCRFIDNKISGYGGGVNIINAQANILKSSFIENSAQEGGGVKVHSGIASIFDCTFIDNEAGLIGGAFSAYDSGTEVERCVFIGNDGPYGGAAECHEGTRAKFVDCLFARNTASTQGGGLTFAIQLDVLVVSCTIVNNTTAGMGGGVFIRDSEGAFINTIFSNNNAHAIYEGDTAADPIVTNCLFDANPDGVYFNEGSNTIQNASGPNSMNSILTEASGNLDGNPKFANPKQDDYHLTKKSPAIDAGAATINSFEDIDGDERPLAIVKGIEGFDIGYDEYNPFATITVKKPDDVDVWEHGQTYKIVWKSEGYTGSRVRLELLRGGKVKAVIAKKTANDGKYKWTVPNDIVANDGYSVRIKDVDDSTFKATSNGGFEITAP